MRLNGCYSIRQQILQRTVGDAKSSVESPRHLPSAGDLPGAGTGRIGYAPCEVMLSAVLIRNITAYTYQSGRESIPTGHQ